MIKQLAGLILLGLSALTVGCESPEDAPAPQITNEWSSEMPKTLPSSLKTCADGRFTVRIHSTIAENHLDAVEGGLKKWEAALGGKVAFHSVISDAPATWESCVITIRWANDLQDNPWAAASFLGSSGVFEFGTKASSGVVFLNRLMRNEYDAETMDAVILHEIGHVLGLDHDESREHSTVMWPKITVPGRIGCEDVRRACDIWACEVICEGRGWTK